ncbi:MAG: hypothetical protein L6R36_008155 [Xanthoria steineri]|nr:MAG: hypothetical protein L6R36_008155 [Xanthoria steineri]
MPLNHSSFTLPALKVAPLLTFLTSSLAHLGFKEHARFGPYVVGLGEERAYFWLAGILSEDVDGKTMDEVLSKQHFAFTAENADQVRVFYDEAMKAGGVDNGKPGLRPHYAPDYYAAFVRDPVCGMNLEVVCRTPGTEEGAGS